MKRVFCVILHVFAAFVCFVSALPFLILLKDPTGVLGRMAISIVSLEHLGHNPVAVNVAPTINYQVTGDER